MTLSVKRYLLFYLNQSSFCLYNNAPITSRFQRYREEILFTCNGAILHDDFNILGLRIKVEKLRVVFSRQGIIIITAQSYIILELCVQSIFSFRNIELVNGNSLFCIIETIVFTDSYSISNCKRERKNKVSYLVVKCQIRCSDHDFACK